MLITLSSLSAAGYFFWQYKELSTNKGDAKAAETIKKISNYMILPSETPSLAVVTDIKKLKGQPFFKVAQNGDELLIFPKETKAILYRPTTGKVINFTLLSYTKPQQQAEPIAAQAGKPNVVVYNGTIVEGLAKKVQTQIAEQVAGVTFLTPEAATNKRYTQTLVVDVTGKNVQAAKEIASVLGATIGKLPAEEKAGKADIVVIAGQKPEQASAPILTPNP
jgi:hypothetical protein